MFFCMDKKGRCVYVAPCNNKKGDCWASVRNYSRQDTRRVRRRGLPNRESQVAAEKDLLAYAAKKGWQVIPYQGTSAVEGSR